MSPEALRPVRAGGFVAVLLTLFLVLATAGTARAQSSFSPFEFALLGDPQIGYGPGGEYADVGRLGQVVDSVNAHRMPLVLVPGDLVQDRSLWQQWLFSWQAGRVQNKLLLAPGNHDIVDLASLAAYRKRHGPDYYEFVFNNCAFVVVNSETARDRRISATEHAAQWLFIERSLAAQRAAGRKHIVLVTHRPPFVDDEREAEDGANWPPETRARLLALARQHGVRWILTGHLHRTHTAQTADGIQLVVVAGSSSSFDRSPVDYRLFRVEHDALTHTRVLVAPAPAEPFSVPGLRGWTPRLFEFSVRHWLFTALYALAALAALRTARALRERHSRVLWRGIAWLLFAFAANMQLDFDELLQELGRIAAQLSGLYPMRHVVTAGALALLLGVAAVMLVRHYRLESRLERGRAGRGGSDHPLTLALAALVVPSAWFCLSAVSHHDLGMLFDEAWWDLAVLAALAVVGVSARRARKAAPAGATFARQPSG